MSATGDHKKTKMNNVTTAHPVVLLRSISMNRWASRALVAFAVLASPTAALPQRCEPSWDGSFGQIGPNGGVFALEVFDDGSGPALYVGGQFTATAGLTTQRIARFDGATWSQVGGLHHRYYRVA